MTRLSHHATANRNLQVQFVNPQRPPLGVMSFQESLPESLPTQSPLAVFKDAEYKKRTPVYEGPIFWLVNSSFSLVCPLIQKIAT